MRFVIVAFFALLLTTAADARPRGIVACPQGLSSPDGCAGAPVGGGIQFSNFFTSRAQQSGQTYSTRPSWNVAGVDYPVGIPAASLPLKDPASATLPTGCTYNGGIFQVTCASSSADVTFDGFDFSLHNCVFLTAQASFTGNVTIKNSKFAYGSNSRCGIYLIQIDGGASLTLLNNQFDGASATSTANAFVTFDLTSGPVIVQYNGFLNGPARFVNSSSTGDFTWKYNYGEGNTLVSGQAHGEQALLNFVGTLVNFTWSYSTFLQTSTAQQSGATASVSPYEQTTPGSAMTNATINNNSLVTNLNAGTVTEGSAGVQFAYITFSNVTMSSNYIDPTGAFSCFSVASAAVITSETLTANINLRDGSVITGVTGRDASPACSGHQ